MKTTQLFIGCHVVFTQNYINRPKATDFEKSNPVGTVIDFGFLHGRSLVKINWNGTGSEAGNHWAYRGNVKRQYP